MIGRTISHYKILEKLGEGGMGVVYKAEDTRLKRLVALKFLHKAAADNEEDAARFMREAQAAASLDHPNICTVYDVDRVDGETFLAMAFIAGRGLDARVAEGPLTLDEAVDFAIQAAEGLQAAHRKGVVHRDVKASNLMIVDEISPKPQIKVLDFGLAQLRGRSKLTQGQSILGTIAYMSPEQTQGEEVDERTDIWALGVALYEMIAGDLPFKGHYDQATMYSILNEDPEPLTSIRSRVPVELEWIIDKCLAKKADERYQSMADLILDLTTLRKKLGSGRPSVHRTQLGTLPPEQPQAVSKPAAPNRKRDRAVAGLVAGLVLALIALGVVALGGKRQTEELRKTRRLDINLPASLPPGAQLRNVAISPDGDRIAFTTTQEDGRIWVRDLSQPVAWAIDGTEGSTHVFWSPDGQLLGYRVERQLRKVPIQGGPSSTLCELQDAFFGGASWTPDGAAVVFMAGAALELYEVSERGGAPKLLGLAVEGGAARKGPGRAGRPGFGGRAGATTELRLVADSRGRQYLLGAMRTSKGETMGLRSLDSGETTRIGPGLAPFYAASGHILYQPDFNGAEIWALPYSLDDLKPTGDAFPVAEGGHLATVSNDGTLVFMADSRPGETQLVWRDRHGLLLGEAGPTQSAIRAPRVSRDGLKIAVSAEESGWTDIWVYESDRNLKTRITRDDSPDILPLWSPDGRSLLFASIREPGRPTLWERSLTPGSAPREIALADVAGLPADWSQDGSIVLLENRGLRRAGLPYLRFGADGRYEEAIAFEEAVGIGRPQLSPDHRYVVFSSRDSGQPQIYVRSFPSGDEAYQVSLEGGDSPRWSADGSQILFVQGDKLMAASVVLKPSFSVAEIAELFAHPSLAQGQGARTYDVSPDGQRFVLVEPVGAAPQPTIRVVLNWLSEYQGRS